MKLHYYPETDSLYIDLSEKVSAHSRVGKELRRVRSTKNFDCRPAFAQHGKSADVIKVKMRKQYEIEFAFFAEAAFDFCNQMIRRRVATGVDNRHPTAHN